MGWSRPDEESRADHFIDERKHDWRPGDKPELATRLDRPITTAEDIALCVRGMKNLPDAAKLIDQYAKMVSNIACADLAEVHANRLAVLIETPLAPKEPVR